MAIFQYTANLAVLAMGYAMINIADFIFSHVNNIVFAVYCRISQQIAMYVVLVNMHQYLLIDQDFSTVITFTHNTHVDDTKYHFNTLMQ